jgi:hypothetical protein
VWSHSHTSEPIARLRVCFSLADAVLLCFVEVFFFSFRNSLKMIQQNKKLIESQTEKALLSLSAAFFRIDDDCSTMGRESNFFFVSKLGGKKTFFEA